MKKEIFGVLAAIILIVIFVTKNLKEENVAVKDSNAPTTEIQKEGGHTVISENLHVPWSLSVLPSGEILATERDGILRIIGKNTKEISVPGVVETGEGGLLGLALHPDFVKNKFIYLYFTTKENGTTINKVVRYIFENETLKENLVVVSSMPGGTNHNGGRIAFGPDNMLYITTGDSGKEDLAQDTKSLAGKILRVNDDGSIPSSNPFNNAVYSYGHRNPQGLAWDTNGNLWETEHGRSGIQSGLDEINLIEKGANYGWPIIEGNETKEGMKNPVAHSGSDDTWAPSGIIFLEGKLYFTGLRGRALYEAEVLPGGKLGGIKTHLKDEYGRLRGILAGVDGSIYITTSNQDGRGDPSPNDDRIIRLSEWK